MGKCCDPHQLMKNTIFCLQLVTVFADNRGLHVLNRRIIGSVLNKAPAGFIYQHLDSILEWENVAVVGGIIYVMNWKGCANDLLRAFWFRLSVLVELLADVSF